MLADDRSTALVDDFASQWLQLDRLGGVQPDFEVFFEFDENLRADMERETKLFLRSQLREDRSLMELLTADYTFVNARLARHYGIPGVYGERFRRVALDGAGRSGLLGHASLLTLTAYPTPHLPRAAGQVAARQHPRHAAPRRRRPTCRPWRRTSAGAPRCRSASRWSSTGRIRRARRVIA